MLENIAVDSFEFWCNKQKAKNPILSENELKITYGKLDRMQRLKNYLEWQMTKMTITGEFQEGYFQCLKDIHYYSKGNGKMLNVEYNSGTNERYCPFAITERSVGEFRKFQTNMEGLEDLYQKLGAFIQGHKEWEKKSNANS